MSDSIPGIPVPQFITSTSNRKLKAPLDQKYRVALTGHQYSELLKLLQKERSHTILSPERDIALSELYLILHRAYRLILQGSRVPDSALISEEDRIRAKPLGEINLESLGGMTDAEKLATMSPKEQEEYWKAQEEALK